MCIFFHMLVWVGVMPSIINQIFEINNHIFEVVIGTSDCLIMTSNTDYLIIVKKARGVLAHSD